MKYYQFLAEQLGDRWGLAKFVFGSREVLLGFTSQDTPLIGKTLIFRQLVFNKQLRETPSKLEETEWEDLSKEEREYAEKLISKFTIDPDWDELKDEYREDAEELIEKKLKGEEIEVELPEVEEETAEEDELGKMKALVGA